MKIFTLFLNFCPLILAFIGGYCLRQFLLMLYDDLLFHFTFTNWNASVKSCPFFTIYSFIYLIISLYQHGLLSFYFILFHNLIFYFVTETVPALANESSFRLAPVSFQPAPSLVLFYFSVLQDPPGSFKIIPAQP